jgi:hypothetical protein
MEGDPPDLGHHLPRHGQACALLSAGSSLVQPGCGGRLGRRWRHRERELRPRVPDRVHPSTAPDLDCSDVPYRNFKVLPPDPHGFDGDGDGIGCET